MSGDGLRLDRFLATHGPLAGRGRRDLAAILARGLVRVNGKRARKGTMLRAGDLVTVGAATGDTEPAASAAGPELAIVHLDDAIVAVDKPPGLPTTRGASEAPSLAAALCVRFPEMAAIDARHAGLVHRLDTGTSGVLVAARSLEHSTRLRAAFAAKRVAKEYLAVVRGRIETPAKIDRPLARHPRSRRRMVIAHATARAWSAETAVVPIGGDARFTLVRLSMRTGVTHQLRVHLAALGHPIVGDTRYGGAAAAPERSDLGIEPPTWHFLHARALAFDDDGLAPSLAAAFPEHWRRLFAARGWTPPDA
ncbi:MAG: RluA family pseudouridine synthase [Deltaproteobacteria bacterium]|nr:RluA family pseudouridine synthase [Deltaproteobacteria bacterium]